MQETAAPINDALTLIHQRNAFYRSKYHMVLGVYILTLFCIAFLIGTLVYVNDHPAPPYYFMTDNSGRFLQDISLQQPNMSEQDIKTYVVKAVESAYSYDFVNYRQQFQSAEKYFTTWGWKNYMKGLQSSNNLLALTQRKLIVLAKVAGPPKLITQGIIGGALAWKYEMPVLVTYLSAPYDDRSKFVNPLTVTIVIQRQRMLGSYKGLGIMQMIARIASASPK